MTTTTAPRQRKTTRRTASPAQVEARDAKLADLHDRLAAEVRALSTGEDWKRWLHTAAKFRTYSFGNQLLIAMQRPDATAVAGYRAWQALGRQATKGEQGIAILAPIVRRAEEPEPGTDPERKVVGYRATYVWDVSQTTGEPLPEAPRPRLLQGEAPDGLWDALTGIAADRGFTVERGDTGTANGYTDFTARRVVVRPDVDDAQAVKTLAHEVGHVLLHDTHDGQPGEFGRPHSRPEQEVEAESVAYLIAAAHGLPTGDYTFAYVTGWAATGDATDPEQVVRDTARRVLAAANTVLAATQGHEADEEVAA